MTIAHLSDLHLSLDHHKANALRFCRTLDYLATLNPDHIVVTGDISWNADVRELHLARTMFEDYGLFSAGRLSVIPGNHDVFGGVHTAEEALNFFSRCKWTPFEDRLATFQEVFHELFDGCVYSSRKHLYPFVKTLGGIALVGLNSVMRHSSLKNPFGSNGLVGKKERERLKALIASPLLKAKSKIVLVHHHFHKPAWESGTPLSGLWLAFESKTMKLRKKKPLLRLFERSKVDLVLHGHHHDNCRYRRNSLSFMNAGGTLMGPDASTLNLNVVRIEDQQLHTEIHRIPSDSSFVLKHAVHREEPVQIAA
jgi:3',5'-cyclic AMP phosphodiesterase CpdA